MRFVEAFSALMSVHPHLEAFDGVFCSLCSGHDDDGSDDVETDVAWELFAAGNVVEVADGSDSAFQKGRCWLCWSLLGVETFNELVGDLPRVGCGESLDNKLIE